MEENMIVIKDLQTFFDYFDWSKDVDENLKHEFEFIIKKSEYLAENITKKETEQYCPNISRKRILMNAEYSKTNKSYQFVRNLPQRIHLRISNNYVALQDFSISYTWENIRKQYKNNKLKIIAPICDEEFELPDGSYSVSDIQDSVEYIIENMKY